MTSVFRRSIEALAGLAVLLFAPSAFASEAELVLPSLDVDIVGINARTLLFVGMAICVLGGLFGLVIYQRLKKLPVHKSMREVSELIYETCKTYLLTQGKFLLVLELLIGTIMVVYFGWLRHLAFGQVLNIVIFSLIGIAGSFGVAIGRAHV